MSRLNISGYDSSAVSKGRSFQQVDIQNLFYVDIHKHHAQILKIAHIIIQKSNSLVPTLLHFLVVRE